MPQIEYLLVIPYDHLWEAFIVAQIVLDRLLLNIWIFFTEHAYFYKIT